MDPAPMLPPDCSDARRRRTLLRRIGACAVGFMVFVAIGRMVDPFQTSARDRSAVGELRDSRVGRPDRSSMSMAADEQTHGAPSRPSPSFTPAPVGSLQGPGLRVDVMLTPQGPRYTVKDANGRVQAELLDADGLAAQFPEFDPARLNAGLMHAPSEDR